MKDEKVKPNMIGAGDRVLPDPPHLSVRRGGITISSAGAPRPVHGWTSSSAAPTPAGSRLPRYRNPHARLAKAEKGVTGGVIAVLI